jgi:hypothetical protein
MDILFNISMEFELHGVKFKYEDDKVYRWYEYKNRPHQWRQKISKTNIHGYKELKFDNKKKSYSVMVHRIVYWLHNRDWDILDSSHHNSIDHINGIRDDNRIENLRNVTCQKNAFNRTKAKGCCWNKQKQKWCAYIRVNKKLKHLGGFELQEDAHQAYLDAKEIYHII